MVRTGLFALLVMALPLVGAADSVVDTRVARINDAFATWLGDRGLTGAIAIRRGGEDLGSFDHGRATDTPFELASLSKAVTAICAAELVARGQLDWSDPVTVGDKDFALGDLITHSAGLGPDSTQFAMGYWLDREPPHRSARVRDFVALRADQVGVDGAFRYNNENYALAALVIEDATGAPYAEICHEIAIAPVGVAAAPSPRAGSFLPWGGWQMTLADYARWHAFWFARDGAYSETPAAYPNVAVDGTARYGLGTFYREAVFGNSYWHYGALCFPWRLRTQSMVATLDAYWTWVVTYDGCVGSRDIYALDRALFDAAIEPLE